MPRGKKKVADIAKEKSHLLDELIKDIDKKHGEGALSTLRGKYAQVMENVSAIPTGSVGLDHILGVGGLPRGRVIEIYGPEAGGKTTLTLHVIAECQKAGGVAVFIDAEHALTPEYAQDVGVDMTELLVNQPACGEDALELVKDLASSGSVDLIIIDSVAALVPRAELEADMDKMTIGLQARMMSSALRKLTGVIGKNGPTVIFINQLRHKIGGYGNPETTPGGNALKYYSSIRLDVRRIGQIKKGEEVIGNRVKVKVVKNKMAPPFRTAEFDLVFGRGISWEGELIDLGVASGAISKKGAWYSRGEDNIGQGRDRVATYLRENPKITAEIQKQVRGYLHGDANV